MRRLRRIFDVALLILCAAAVAFWVRSAYHQELIGTHSVSVVQNGRVLEGWVGVYSGSGGFAVGSTLRSWKAETFELVRAAPALPTKRFGHFDAVRSFEDEDGLGFGMVHRVHESPPPPNVARASLRQGRMPVFTFEGRESYVTLPYWVVVLIGVLRVGWLAWPRRDARNVFKTRPAFCPACGYDLRATPDRCPECGRAATTF